MYVGKSPVPLTPELLHEGQTKFNTYCTPCHDRTGSGQGIVPTRVPTWQPSNLTEDRVVQFADGDIFNVITNGRRTMPAYRFQITVEDRWAIIAYVRALQRAAHAHRQADVPADQRGGVAMSTRQHDATTRIDADSYQLEASRWATAATCWCSPRWCR